MSLAARLVASVIAIAGIAGGGLVVNETLLAGCSADIAVGESFQAAYAAADISAGDVELTVASGEHPGQALTRDPLKANAQGDVIFVGCDGAKIVGGLSSGISGGSVTSATGAEHWQLRGIDVSGEIALRWGSNDVVLEDFDAGNLRITSSSNVQARSCKIGPWVNQVLTINSAGGAPGVFDVEVANCFVHDYTITDPAKHSECSQVWPSAPSARVRFVDVDFRNCTDFGVLVKAPALTDMEFVRVTADVPMPGNVATATCNPDCPRGGSSIRFSTHEYPGAKVVDSRLGGGLAIDKAGFVQVVNSCANCDPGPVTHPITTTPPPTTTEPTMTTYADDFERASLGANWTKHFGDVGIIGSSDLGLTGPSAFALLSWAASVPADQFSEAEISANIPAGIDKGVYVRRRASDGARYQFHYDSNGTDTDPRPHWQIKYDGVPTAQTRILASNFAEPGDVPGDVLRVEVRGQEIRGYKNGVLILSVTDTVLTSGGIGVALLKVGGVTAPTPIFERWAGGELVAAPPPPPPPPPDSLPLTILSQTATTVTVGWTPQGDAGYLFLVDGVSVSNTNDPARDRVTFAKKPGAKLEVRARSVVASGSVVSP